VGAEKKQKLSSYGSVERRPGNGFVNAGLNTGNSGVDPEPANPTNPFLAKPMDSGGGGGTNPFATSQ